MTASQKLRYWLHRVRVRTTRLASFKAKKRYWKARWRKAHEHPTHQNQHERRLTAERVRHFDDLIDATADLLERAKRGAARYRRQVRAVNADRASAHFRIAEFNCKDGTPVPKAAHDGVRELAEKVLEPLREEFGGCHVTSGYRHAAYNRRIGGAERSYHIYDLRPGEVAADVWFDRGSVAEWARAARKLGYGGVGDYPSSRFIHVDMGPRRDWSG